MNQVINRAASIAPLVFACASLWIERRHIDALVQVVADLMARLYEAAEIKGEESER